MCGIDNDNVHVSLNKLHPRVQITLAVITNCCATEDVPVHPLAARGIFDLFLDILSGNESFLS